MTSMMTTISQFEGGFLGALRIDGQLVRFCVSPIENIVPWIVGNDVFPLVGEAIDAPHVQNVPYRARSLDGEILILVPYLLAAELMNVAISLDVVRPDMKQNLDAMFWEVFHSLRPQELSDLDWNNLVDTQMEALVELCS